MLARTPDNAIAELRNSSIASSVINYSELDIEQCAKLTGFNKHKKVKKLFLYLPVKSTKLLNYLLCLGSSETVSFLLPFARRAFSTLRPLAVDILSLNPCLFFLFLFDG